MENICLYLITGSLVITAYNLSKFNREMAKKKKFFKNLMVMLVFAATPVKAQVVKFHNVYDKGRHIFKYYKKIVVDNKMLFCDIQDKVEMCKYLDEWVEWRKQNPIKMNNEDMSYL